MTEVVEGEREREARVRFVSVVARPGEPAVTVGGSWKMGEAVPEDESVNRLSLALLEQQLGEEVGKRHAARLVALRSAGDYLARDVDRVLPDEHATSHEVEIVRSEPDCFAPSDSGVYASISTSVRCRPAWCARSCT